ncbi:hypothetical protein D3C71_1934720 [compost metagenome]
MVSFSFLLSPLFTKTSKANSLKFLLFEKVKKGSIEDLVFPMQPKTFKFLSFASAIAAFLNSSGKPSKSASVFNSMN